MISFKGQKTVSIEYRIECTFVVFYPFTVLEGNLSFLIDAQRTPARLHPDTFGYCRYYLVRTCRKIASLFERNHVDKLCTLP